MAGLLIGLLGSPAEAAQMPLSRWQVEESQIRYQVSLFPFGFAEAEKTAMVPLPQEAEAEYEIRFKVLEWWGELFG